MKKKEPEIIWHFTKRRPEQQVEYLQKTELIAANIANRVFYKRIGFWYRQCDFLPICTRSEAEQKEKLVKIQ